MTKPEGESPRQGIHRGKWLTRRILFAGDAPASKEYLDGLMEITRFIKQVLKTPPAIYLPPTLLHAQTSTYPDLVRYGLVEHLVSVAADVLGDGAFAAPLPLKDNKILGANKEGRTSVAGLYS